MSAEVLVLGTFERVLALKRIPAFADLHPADLSGLAERAVARRLSAGAAVPAAAESASVHFVVEGAVRTPGDGAVHDAPVALGVLEVLAGRPAPPLWTEAASIILEIDRTGLLAVLEDEFDVWLATLRHVCRRALAHSGSQHVSGAGAHTPAPPPADPSDLAERIAVLRAVAPFAGLPIHVLGQIASRMEPLVLRSGDSLCEPDAAPGHVLAILSGVVRCWRGERVVDLGAGALVGLPEAICVGRCDYRAEARGVVHALRLEAEALIDVLEDDPEAALELLCVVARGAVGDGEGGDEDGDR